MDEDEDSLILLLLELAFNSFAREAAVDDMIAAFGTDDDIIVLGLCVGLIAIED